MRQWAEMQGSEDVDRLNYAGHAAIYEAILARDPDLAEEAMRGHLEAAWSLVRTTFRAYGTHSPPSAPAPSQATPT